MEPPVKRRSYRSDVRTQRAAETRGRILEAAGRLFLEVGFARATIREIAAEAAVSPDLVFHIFGSKRGLLEAVMSDAADGDVAGPLVGVGPEVVPDEPDQRHQIAVLAEAVGEQLERSRPLDDMLRTAAIVDPGLASLREDLHLRGRREAMTEAVAWIADRGALRQPLHEAAALVWTLASPEVHQMLVDGWGWPTEQYVAWLRANLEAALLPA